MFDQNMLNELARLKVDRTRKKSEEEEVQAELNNQPDHGDDNDDDYYDDEEDEEEFEELEGNTGLDNIAEFLGDNITKKKIDPNKLIKETDTDKDFSTKEQETKSIVIAGRRAVRTLSDTEGKEVNSKFLDDAGNINVVYGEPGKNVVNRKPLEERRLDLKMEALSDLISKFKTEDEIDQENSDESVIIMDTKSEAKKDLKRVDQISYIKDGLEMKLSLVINTFSKLSKEIEKQAGLPEINLNITNPDNLRALFSTKSIDDMDVSRIFLFSLFLESPQEFPSHDTFEQIEYRNSQIGAKAKAIDLKRTITYISSDNEFNSNIEIITQITKKTLDTSLLKELINYKAKEALKTMMIKYLKSENAELLNKVSVITIKKDTQMKYRGIDSTLSFSESLKSKLKALPPSMKEQIKKTEEDIKTAIEKANTLRDEISKLEKELTIMILLNFSVKSPHGYSRNFFNNLPIEEIKIVLHEYNVNFESENVQDILTHGISESMFNDILKSR